MKIPPVDIIAKVIAGPNDASAIGWSKLRELQDVRWGQLKSQEQNACLRSARFVIALFEMWQRSELEHRLQPAAQGDYRSRDPVLREGDGTASQPAPILPVDRASTSDVLRLFRQFVDLNARQWALGALDHHHPIWEMVAYNIDAEENKDGPDWQFIQPENRQRHAVLIEEFVNAANVSGTTTTNQDIPERNDGDAGH